MKSHLNHIQVPKLFFTWTILTKSFSGITNFEESFSKISASKWFIQSTDISMEGNLFENATFKRLNHHI